MIGLLSDSHDHLISVRAAVRLFAKAGCRLVLHAGDVVAPFAARELGAAGCPVKAVFGNCDGEKTGLREAFAPFGEIREGSLSFRHEGLDILVVHLDGPAAAFAERGEFDLVVHGHTHRAGIRRIGRTLVVNPGEAGGWVTGKATVAIFDPKTLRAEILPL